MESIRTYDEKELLLKAAEGDENAFKELYDCYERMLRPFLTELTKSSDTAGDLIQETLLRVWINREHISKLDHPRAYIYRIAANLSNSWLRSQLSRRHLEKNAPYESQVPDEGDSNLSIKAIREIVTNAILTMPPKRSQIYMMHREHGMKVAEIAEKLGVSASTVKNTLSQAMKYIQEQVEKAGYYLPICLLTIFF